MTAQEIEFRGYAAALVAVTALAVVLVTSEFGTPWPQRDSFIFLDWLGLWQQGTLDLKMVLLARNNEHLIGVHGLLSLLLLVLADGNSKILIYANGLLLLAAIILLIVTIKDESAAKRWPLMLALACVLPLLNPSQASYFLWEFQTWWYLVLFACLFCIFAVERWDTRAYPFVLVACIAMTASGVQGAFLWLVVGAHYLLLNWRYGFPPGPATRARSAIAVGHAVMFLLVVALVLGVRKGGTDVQIELLGMPLYYVQLIGSGFGLRSPALAFALGAAALALWVIVVVLCVRHAPRSTRVQRVGLLLSAFGLLLAAAFAAGRQTHGIAWALWNFHGTPPLLPFYLGLALLGVESMTAVDEAGVRQRLVGSAAAMLALTTVLTAAPAGAGRADELRRVASAAHVATCSGDAFPRHVLLRLNGLEGHGYLFDRVRGTALAGCGRPADLHRAEELLRAPEPLLQVARGEPATEAAVVSLWWIYATRLDLQRAFPPTSPSMPQKLLEFAYFNAKGGSGYEQELLSQHAQTFLRIGEKK